MAASLYRWTWTADAPTLVRGKRPTTSRVCGARVWWKPGQNHLMTHRIKTSLLGPPCRASLLLGGLLLLLVRTLLLDGPTRFFGLSGRP